MLRLLKRFIIVYIIRITIRLYLIRPICVMFVFLIFVDFITIATRSGIEVNRPILINSEFTSMSLMIFTNGFDTFCRRILSVYVFVANMGLPKVGENLELVTYASLPEDKALEQVEKYNKQGREGGYGNIGHHKRDHRDDRNNRWHNRGSGGGPRREFEYISIL